VITTNLRTARVLLAGTVVEYVEPVVETSVAWFRITVPDLNATELQRRLLDGDVYVLPGTYFYWNQPEVGERYIRIALARRPEMFVAAMGAMREVLDSHDWRSHR
jgi:aspartate/methionine/tyrosine aminotransferase